MARKTARLGRQTPTQALVLPYDETKGGEAVELYEQGGRTAMDWQKVLLYDMMAVDDDGLWMHSAQQVRAVGPAPERQKRDRQDAGAAGAVPWRAHPAHRAPHDDKAQRVDFYQRPPCGGGRTAQPFRIYRITFLSTSPLGGTTSLLPSCMIAALFLSTSPLRGTTANVTENTVYFPAHLSQQDTAYKNTLRFCAGCGRFRGASARSALKMLCSPVRTARRFSAR